MKRKNQLLLSFLLVSFTPTYDSQENNAHFHFFIFNFLIGIFIQGQQRFCIVSSVYIYPLTQKPKYNACTQKMMSGWHNSNNSHTEKATKKNMWWRLPRSLFHFHHKHLKTTQKRKSWTKIIDSVRQNFQKYRIF